MVQVAARGPPRLLCLAVLSLLAMASFYIVFVLLGMQVFRNYHDPSSVRSQSHQQIPGSVSFQRPAEAGSDQELQQQGLQDDGVWSPLRSWRQLLPYAAPRDGSYRAPVFPGSGFLFATIKGELHEIHAAVCDFVVIARLLNATIVLPKIQGTASVKGGGNSKVEGFNYLYDENHFVIALKNDVRIVKHLPKQFRSRDHLQKQPVKMPTRFSSVRYYLDKVLSALTAHGACGLVFSNGGGLQLEELEVSVLAEFAMDLRKEDQLHQHKSFLPPELIEYQRLRCRVAFQALRFRREIQDLGVQLVRRLKAHGQPYVVVHLGLERDVLAHHGCAELFQDLQTESIQLQRNHFLTNGKEVGELQIDSQKQRQRGLCPLMPAEVGLLLESYGFCNSTRIYLTGTEITGGQRLLLHLRSVYANLEDRFTMSTVQERIVLQPPKMHNLIPDTHGKAFVNTLKKFLFWRKKKHGPFAKASHKGWWRTVGDCKPRIEDYFARASMEGDEAQDIPLLLTALDYMVSLEADTYFPAFDKDRHGLPNIASLITGHRLYQYASLKTFHPNRSILVSLLDDYPHENLDNLSLWRLSMKILVTKFLIRPEDAPPSRKLDLFISHPIPECVCYSSRSNNSQKWEPKEGFALVGINVCPVWMSNKY